MDGLGRFFQVNAVCRKHASPVGGAGETRRRENGTVGVTDQRKSEISPHLLDSVHKQRHVCSQKRIPPHLQNIHPGGAEERMRGSRSSCGRYRERTHRRPDPGEPHWLANYNFDARQRTRRLPGRCSAVTRTEFKYTVVLEIQH